MMFLSKQQIIEKQKKMQQSCEDELFEFLDSSIELVIPILSENTMTFNDHQQAGIAPHEIIVQKVDEYKNWISNALDKAIIASSVVEEYNESHLEPVKFPKPIAHKLILSLLEILTCEMDLLDNSLMFLSDIGNALEIAPSLMDTFIEQNQYKKRKELTQLLLKHLNKEQQQWVAQRLWEAVHVDTKVHPREYKYFENVMHLLEYDQIQIDQLEEQIGQIEPITEPSFDPKFSSSIYQYIVEIVMIDGEYSPDEAKFIKQVGEALGYDQHQQDEIIQPVASTLMLRRSLF